MPNKLAGSTSPYLLQHANNPVDWHLWGDEALSKAKREDKPILLSIGYAACHWCHVMERESFEDAETAALMNEHFVPIKVDREERPDLDAIYMDAVQAMTGHGGWPMTMFCSPEGVPLYGGTYFPPEDRHGLPAFRRVLQGVADAWKEKREELLGQGQKLVEYIGSVPNHAPEAPPAAGSQTLREAFDRMAGAFDSTWGGFGRAPKFPQPMNLEFLLRAVRLGFQGAGRMLALTLSKMARGGVFDQIGGGFHRYSVDGEWLVPHFEKMLYDNGQLLRLYARAALASPAIDGDEALYRSTAIATGEFLLREMRHAQGGFFSSLDADSEGVEGKFYVWSFEDVLRAAGPDASIATAFWSVTPAGNFEGTNILWAPRTDEDVASEQGIKPDELRAAEERARARLFDARSSRIRPATDDKVLTSWNGLAISGLAEAGRAFGRADFIDAAVTAASFVLSSLRSPEGRLLRSWRDGRTSGPAYLDDYSIFAGALLDLYETTFDERWYDEALRIVSDMIELFADPKGGFYDTGSDTEALVVRPKDLFDNAVPSGNSVAAEVLLRIAALTGDHSYEERAEATLALTRAAMSTAPLGFGHALGALDWSVSRPKEVAIADGGGAGELARAVWDRPMLNRVLAVGDPATTHVPLLRERVRRDGKATAYVCENFTCTLPVTDASTLADLLDE